MQARFIQGNPQFVDITPASAILAGDVLIQNDVVLIAHSDILAGENGALAIGGGIYEALCLTNGVTYGLQLDWDDTANGVTDGTSGTKNIGYAVSEGSNGDDIRFYHQNAG